MAATQLHPRWPGQQAVTPRISSGSHLHRGTGAHPLRICCCFLPSPGGGRGCDLITPERGCSGRSISTVRSPLLVARARSLIRGTSYPSLHCITCLVSVEPHSCTCGPVTTGMHLTLSAFPPSLSCFSSPFWCTLCLATFPARVCTTYTRSFYCTSASSRARQLTLPRRLCVYFMPSFLRPVVQSWSCMCPLITPCVVFILGVQPLALRCSFKFMCSAGLSIVHKCIGYSHSSFDA